MESGKKTNKNNKKVHGDKKHPKLELNDGTITRASCVYKRDTQMLKIQGIDLDKIKLSERKRYSKHNKVNISTI